VDTMFTGGAMESRLARRRMRTRRHRLSVVRRAPLVVERGRSDMERAVALLVRELGAVEVEAQGA
jgi:hypothetical protein